MGANAGALWLVYGMGWGGGGGGRVWGRHKFTIPNTFLTHVINLLALGESTS